MTSENLYTFDAHQEDGIRAVQAALERKRHHQAVRDAAVREVAQQAGNGTDDQP